MKATRILIALFLNVLCASMVQAQDFTMSQFETYGHVFNPAFIGSNGKDLRFSLGYRNQWFATGYNYQTMLFSGEWRANPFPRKLRQVATSLVFADDQVGNGQWRNTWLSMGGSATKDLDDAQRHRLSFGLSGSLLLRQFNAKDLLFENQFESSTFSFNPEISSGENATMLRQTFFQLNSGWMYQFSYSEKFRFKSGCSLLWLYRPQENLSNLQGAAARMNSRVTGLASLYWKLSKDISLEPQVFYSVQGKARDFNTGGWITFSTYIEGGQTWHTGMGLFTRLGDSVIPALRIGNGTFAGQLSYDITKSSATKNNADVKFMGVGGMGALEFSILYGFQLKGRASKRFPIPCQTI